MKYRITGLIVALALSGCAGTKPTICDGSSKKPINTSKSTLRAPHVIEAEPVKVATAPIPAAKPIQVIDVTPKSAVAAARKPVAKTAEAEPVKVAVAPTPAPKAPQVIDATQKPMVARAPIIVAEEAKWYWVDSVEIDEEQPSIKQVLAAPIPASGPALLLPSSTAPVEAQKKIVVAPKAPKKIEPKSVSVKGAAVVATASPAANAIQAPTVANKSDALNGPIKIVNFWSGKSW